MHAISREETRTLMYEIPGMKVIEALDPEAFADFHLPGATNVPLDDDFDAHIQEEAPNKGDPVLVYCMDASCQASTKAGERMEELGYSMVFDYEAGKMDWKSAGLPIEK